MANIRTLKDIKKDSGPPGGGGGMGPPGAPGGGGGGGGGGGIPGMPSIGGGPESTDPKNVIIISSEHQYRQELASARGLVVVDFSAGWCQPCKYIFPYVAEFSVKYKDVKFLKVDVDQFPRLADENNVTAMPTFHFIRNGALVDEIRGANHNVLEEKIIKNRKASDVESETRSWGRGQSLSGNVVEDFTQQPAQPSQPSQAKPIPSITPVSGGDLSEEARAFVNMLVDMGFPSNRATNAVVATEGASLEAALDWLENHPEAQGGGQSLGQAIDSAPPSNIGTGASQPTDMDVDVDVDVDEDEEAILRAVIEQSLKEAGGSPANEITSESAADTQDTAPKSEDVTMSEPAEPEKTLEEKKLEMKEKLERIREQRRLEDEKRALDAEKARVMSGKSLTKTRKVMEEEREKREARELREKKRKEKKYREEVLAKVRAAKKERQQQNQPAETAQQPTAPVAQIESKECSLAIRGPSGTIKHTFQAEDTMQQVFDFVAQQVGHRNFTLTSNFPRKVYSASSSLSITLKEAELVPRGALIMQ